MSRVLSLVYIAFSVWICYLVFEWTRSFIYLFLFAMMFWFFHSVIWNKDSEKINCILDSVFVDKFPAGEKVDYQKLYLWVKGFGSIDGMICSTAARINHKCLELMFITSAQEFPFLIPLDEVEVRSLFTEDKGVLKAELKIDGVENAIVVRWDNEWNTLVRECCSIEDES